MAYGFSSFDSNAMKSRNPHSGIYEADTSRTLDLNGGNPACNQGGGGCNGLRLAKRTRAGSQRNFASETWGGVSYNLNNVIRTNHKSSHSQN